MIFYDGNAPGPNPVAVRFFVLERGGLEFDVTTIDLANLENRRKPYRDTVNARGEVPALKLDNGEIITEITAICEYFDEIAKGGTSLYGDTPEQRAETRMWTRRVYLEICHPLASYWRGGEDAATYYRGNRVPATEAQPWHRIEVNRGLNQLDDDLEGRTFLCGDRFSMADIMLYAFVAVLGGAVAWVNAPGRLNVTAWQERVAARSAAQAAMNPLPAHINA